MFEQEMQAISTIGFPIFVTLWFMFRFEKVLKELTEAINCLKIEVAKKNPS